MSTQGAEPAAAEGAGDAASIINININSNKISLMIRYIYILYSLIHLDTYKISVALLSQQRYYVTNDFLTLLSVELVFPTSYINFSSTAFHKY